MWNKKFIKLLISSVLPLYIILPIGWNLRETTPEDLVSEALRRALAVRQPAAGLLVHSDQDSQFTATCFRKSLAGHGAEQSMSRGSLLILKS